MNSHTYATTSLVSGMFAWLMQYQPELSAIATIIAILAGAISIWKGIRGK